MHGFSQVLILSLDFKPCGFGAYPKAMGAIGETENLTAPINPLETILRHQWTLSLPFGDAHARP
jgi:hypothetical protein